MIMVIYWGSCRAAYAFGLYRYLHKAFDPIRGLWFYWDASSLAEITFLMVDLNPSLDLSDSLEKRRNRGGRRWELFSLFFSLFFSFFSKPICQGEALKDLTPSPNSHPQRGDASPLFHSKNQNSFQWKSDFYRKK